jgi:undecaprenyl-diphosphatase
VIFGGVVAGQGVIRIVPLIGLVWACAVAGDVTSYLIGRRLGREFLIRHGRRLKITRQRLEQVERFFDRYGGATILVGRFVGLVRALAPFIAGASRMPFGRFFPFDVVAAGVWSAFFCLLGYVFWQSFDQAVAIAKRGAVGLGAVLAGVVAGVALYRYLRVHENRERASAWLERQGERPLLRPVARVVRPAYGRVLRPLGQGAAGPLRFVRGRLTPGELGLELTTLLAVALVGWYVYAALALLVTEGRSFFADSRAFDVAGSVRLDLTVSAVRVTTEAGSVPVVGGVVLAAVIYLLARREVMEAAVLVVASLITYGAVNVAKAQVARPRPEGALYDPSTLSFPSGHAAYSVAYVAVTVAVVRVLPHFIYRAAAVTVSLVVAAAVGLSRVYLEVHYLSDVLAGWGLAAAIFATCALVAMIVAFVRQNPRAG